MFTSGLFRFLLALFVIAMLGSERLQTGPWITGVGAVVLGTILARREVPRPQKPAAKSDDAEAYHITLSRGIGDRVVH